MSSQSQEWLLWFSALAIGAAMLCGCTTELEREALSRLDQHLGQAATEAAALRRAIPAESEAAPAAATLEWRLSTRAKPLAAELSRIKGRVVVDVPVAASPVTRALLEENELLDELEAQPEEPRLPPLQPSGGMGLLLGTIATLAGGGGAAGITKMIVAKVRKKLQAREREAAEASRRAEKAQQMVYRLHETINDAKESDERVKQAVAEAVSKRPDVHLSYEQAKVQFAQAAVEREQENQRILPGLKAVRL